LAGELDFVDQSIGKFVKELKAQRLFESTLIIISAKHGQSPIDGSKRRGIGGGQPAAAIGSAGRCAISSTTQAPIRARRTSFSRSTRA
jgi:arylsulfatase A-like enzyme